jgi:predicted dehydrogenase
MAPVRVGVVGCGMISRRRYLPELARNPAASIVAVTDVNGVSARQASIEFTASIEPDAATLLARDDVDAVVVAIPNRYHFAVGHAALLAGKHLLLEKPMGRTLAEADALIAAADERGLTLMMALNQPFMPVHQAVKQMLDAGTIGRVHRFAVQYGHGGPESWSPPATWFYDRDAAFAGALLDLGIHKIDLLLWLLETGVEQVSAMAGTYVKASPLEDNAVCLLRMRDGAIGTLSASWTAFGGEQNDLTLYGDLGRIEVDGTAAQPLAVVLEKPAPGRFVVEVPAIETNATSGLAPSGVIDHFLESIVTGREPLVSGRVSRASLEVVIAALHAARRGEVVSLPLGAAASL